MKSEIKHTPGPWRFSFESTDPEWAVITALRGICVANVNADTRQEANARLIAAAPDLLEACKGLLVWGGYVKPSQWRIGLPTEKEAMDAALAAIQKAEGAS